MEKTVLAVIRWQNQGDTDQKKQTYAMFSRDDFKLALEGLDMMLSPRYSQPQPENKQKNMAQH